MQFYVYRNDARTIKHQDSDFHILTLIIRYQSLIVRQVWRK